MGPNGSCSESTQYRQALCITWHYSWRIDLDSVGLWCMVFKNCAFGKACDFCILCMHYSSVEWNFWSFCKLQFENSLWIFQRYLFHVMDMFSGLEPVWLTLFIGLRVRHSIVTKIIVDRNCAICIAQDVVYKYMMLSRAFILINGNLYCYRRIAKLLTH